jgi:uncharacterized protein YbjQ (UPF0145 family)
MRCQTCGHENSEAARFCARCGGNLSPEADLLVAGVEDHPQMGEGFTSFAVSPGMVTTGLGFEGYRIDQYLGVVRGLTVRSRGALGNAVGSVQSFFGGSISVYVDLCERARADAYQLMVRHANQLNANAIIGMRYDANEVMEGITEVLAYGTAVIVQTDRPVDHQSR